MFHHAKKQSQKVQTKSVFRIEHIWKRIISLFLIALLLCLGFFFWYFMDTGKKLDREPVLGEDTTGQKLSIIEKRVSGVEQAIRIRTGTSQ